MHPSAITNGKRFFDTYAKHKDAGLVVDIGSQDVNGSLKEIMPDRFNYIGVDFQEAKNVDIVLKDPYILPFESESVDIVVSSSCLEHSEFFWLTFLEMVRITKPDGLIYINAPSSGPHHAFPVDCWRYRIDASMALMNWANHNGYNTILLEAFVDVEPMWHDMVAIYIKDKTLSNLYPDRIDL